MSLNDLGLEDYEEEASKALILDGDLIIFKVCCVFDEDDDASRRQIKRQINSSIDSLMLSADCDKYILFVTTKFNFRDQLVDDYKKNRDTTYRPVNLTWAKNWAVSNLNTHYHKGLEADDLLGIHCNDDTVIWSADKDLRQLPGVHLDDATKKLKTITEEGRLEEVEGDIYFEGLLGFYYQLLIGDSTDYIVGCGVREPAVWKSGKKKGQEYMKRRGVGSKGAFKKIAGAVAFRGEQTPTEAALKMVAREYQKLHGKEWLRHLETQANLLFMIREQHGELVKRWTFDGREEYFDLTKGEIVYDLKGEVEEAST